MLFLNYCILSGKVVQKHKLGVVGNNILLIAYFIGNTYAKYYENPTMLSRVTAKNVGDVFETQCRVTMNFKINSFRPLCGVDDDNGADDGNSNCSCGFCQL